MGQGPSKQAPASSPWSTENDVSSSEPAVPDIGPEDTVIAVMGLTGVGKSTFISYFSDTAVVGDDLESCTSTLSIHPATISDRTIYLIDTPGFDDTNRTDTDILKEIALWLHHSYDASVKLAGIVYLHRIQDNRVGGSGVKNIHLFRELCGTDCLSSVVLATTMWDTVPDQSKAEEREAELKTSPDFWAGLLEHGCSVLRQDDGVASATKILEHIIAQSSSDSKQEGITLQIQEEIAEEGKALHETSAGEVLKASLEEQQRLYEAKTALLEEQLSKIASELASLQDAQATRDEQVRQEREREQREVEKREISREEEIIAFKRELDRLREDLHCTRVKQEKTEAEYRELTSNRWPWNWCIVM
ncbi:P-loop containing nucleoside triphosphate hydrolase protein [Rhypophila decipiens]